MNIQRQLLRSNARNKNIKSREPLVEKAMRPIVYAAIGLAAVFSPLSVIAQQPAGAKAGKCVKMPYDHAIDSCVEQDFEGNVTFNIAKGGRDVDTMTIGNGQELDSSLFKVNKVDAAGVTFSWGSKGQTVTLNYNDTGVVYERTITIRAIMTVEKGKKPGTAFLKGINEAH